MQKYLLKLTSSTPRTITEGLTRRSTLWVEDFDGEGGAWEVAAPCAKVVVFNSRNLTLKLSHPILTSTLELFASSNITLHLSVPVDLVQLDPPLDFVSLAFAPSANLTSTLVLAPSSVPQKLISGLTLSVLNSKGEPESHFVIADDLGNLHEPQTPNRTVRASDLEGAQWVFKWVDGGWLARPLARSERNYPVL